MLRQFPFCQNFYFMPYLNGILTKNEERNPHFPTKSGGLTKMATFLEMLQFKIITFQSQKKSILSLFKNRKIKTHIFSVFPFLRSKI